MYLKIKNKDNASNEFQFININDFGFMNNIDMNNFIAFNNQLMFIHKYNLTNSCSFIMFIYTT